VPRSPVAKRLLLDAFRLCGQVRVKFARRTSGIPGVPGRPEPAFRTGQLDEDATVKEVRLRREKLALSPVFYTALQVIMSHHVCHADPNSVSCRLIFCRVCHLPCGRATPQYTC
jgi:hypothetical protein